MDLNNRVKTFKSYSIVKSFFYLIIVFYITNYLMNNLVIFWYLHILYLYVIGFIIFFVLLFDLIFILRKIKLNNIFVLSIIVLYIIVKTFFIDIFIIRNKSMEPALKEYQIVLIDKLHYGWNIPYFLFPLGRVGYKKICISNFCHLKNLVRFDIIVFDFPDPVMRTRKWIKRLIIFQNEEYEFKQSQLFINHKSVDIYKKIDFLPEYHATPIFDLPVELKNYPEFLQFSFLYGIGKKGIVPENSYIMIGDNVTMSRDSRIFGFIPEDRIIGKVIYVF